MLWQGLSWCVDDKALDATWRGPRQMLPCECFIISRDLLAPRRHHNDNSYALTSGSYIKSPTWHIVRLSQWITFDDYSPALQSGRDPLHCHRPFSTKCRWIFCSISWTAFLQRQLWPSPFPACTLYVCLELSIF